MESSFPSTFRGLWLCMLCPSAPQQLGSGGGKGFRNQKLCITFGWKLESCLNKRAYVFFCSPTILTSWPSPNCRYVDLSEDFYKHAANPRHGQDSDNPRVKFREVRNRIDAFVSGSCWCFFELQVVQNELNNQNPVLFYRGDSISHLEIPTSYS